MTRGKNASHDLNPDLIVTAAYLLLFVIISGLYVSGLEQRDSSSTAVVMTLPWSYWGVPLKGASGYPVWYNYLGQTGNVIGFRFLIMLGFLPGALINAVILYFGCNFLSRIGRAFRIKRKRYQSSRGESAAGVSPAAARRTVRKPLDLHGSRC
jgi:hypothetical protein